MPQLVSQDQPYARLVCTTIQLNCHHASGIIPTHRKIICKEFFEKDAILSDL